MALGDIVSNVLTRYKADASDQIRELQRLKGKISDTQKAELDAHKSREETYQRWLTGITGVNQGLELAAKAIGFAKDAWKSYSDHLRVTLAAGKTNIEALRTASLGLRTEHELLTFAAQTQNAVIKVSQKDMETAQRAMVALTRAGFDQREVTDKITQSLVKAKAEGLDDFGLAIKTGKTDLENYTNIMEALAAKASGVQDGTLTAAEGVDKLGVTVQDSMDKMKQSIGQLVQSMGPLLSALANAVALIADLAKGHMDVQQAGGVGGYILQQQGFVRDPDNPNLLIRADELRARQAIQGFSRAGDVGAFRARQAIDLFAAQGTPGALSFGPIDFWGGAASGIDEATFLTRATSFQERLARARRGGSGGGPSSVASLVNMGGTDVLGAGAFSGSLGATAGINVNDREILDQIEAMRTGDLTKDWFARLEEQRSQKTSFLESTFGKLEDFNAYQEAFSMLTGSVSAGLNAWITGSMSAGQAFKKFISDALAGLSSQMAIEALKHTAYAIGSAAFGDAKGAATHGAAAVAFGAGAAAAAVAAKTLGGGGGATTGAPGVSGASASVGRGGGGGSGGAPQPTQINYILVGSDHAENSPRMMQRKAQRLVSLADNKTSAGGAF